jgi:hypothetical protein
VAARVPRDDDSTLVDQCVKDTRTHPVDVRIRTESVVQQDCGSIARNRVGVVFEDVEDDVAAVVSD